MTFTDTQKDMIRRMMEYLPREGSASECHEHYCPANINYLLQMIGDDGVMIGNETIDVPEYCGKPDGFDSQCPRFLAVDRESGEWECLSGLDMLARALNVPKNDLTKIVDERRIE